MVYEYDQEIPIQGTGMYPIVISGQVFAMTVRDPNQILHRIRIFRNSEDEPASAVRMYNNVRQNNVLVVPDEGWIQIPNLDTDVQMIGDLETGVMTFRMHLEPEPVSP
jgi:hypothetical protein